LSGGKHRNDWNNIAAFPSAPASRKVGETPHVLDMGQESASLIGALIG
jgi:hypothetical protein